MLALKVCASTPNFFPFQRRKGLKRTGICTRWFVQGDIAKALAKKVGDAQCQTYIRGSQGTWPLACLLQSCAENICHFISTLNSICSSSSHLWDSRHRNSWVTSASKLFLFGRFIRASKFIAVLPFLSLFHRMNSELRALKQTAKPLCYISTVSQDLVISELPEFCAYLPHLFHVRTGPLRTKDHELSPFCGVMARCGIKDSLFPVGSLCELSYCLSPCLYGHSDCLVLW